VPSTAIDIARIALADQIAALYSESFAIAVSRLHAVPQNNGNPLFTYTAGLRHWNRVAVVTIPMVVDFVALADLCGMCTLRGLEDAYRTTLHAHFRRIYDADTEIPDITEMLMAVLSPSH